MNLKFWLAGLTLFVASMSNAALISLDSTGASNNGQRGIMFDISVGNSAISLSEISTYFYDGDTADYEFYYVEGGLSGNENTSSAWTLHDSIINFTGTSNQTTWDFSNLLLNANTTYGLYFTNTTGGGIQYDSNFAFGQEMASDVNLTIYAGLGRSYAFGNIYNGRGFAGSLSYELTETNVPEPSILSILALSLIGMSFRRLKR